MYPENKPPKAEDISLFIIKTPAQAFPDLAHSKLITRLPPAMKKLMASLDTQILNLLERISGPMPNDDLVFTQAQLSTLIFVRQTINELIIEDTKGEGELGDSIDDVFNEVASDE